MILTVLSARITYFGQLLCMWVHHLGRLGEHKNVDFVLVESSKRSKSAKNDVYAQNNP